MLIGRTAGHALRALLALAQEPELWRSGAALAASQELPAPMLEQVLLQLRRAGLVEARRGRHGGYRLRRPAAEISLAHVLAAIDAHPAEGNGARGSVAPPGGPADAEGRVTEALQHRLRLALDRELQRLTLEDLQFDLRSARAALREEGGLLLG